MFGDANYGCMIAVTVGKGFVDVDLAKGAETERKFRGVVFFFGPEAEIV